MIRVCAAVASLAFLAGCADEVDQRPATWSYLFPAIVEPSCAGVACHSKFSRTAGLELADADRSYPALLTRLVVPGSPEQSKLVYLLRGLEAPRMPPDGALPEPDIALLERWISGGAPR